MAFKLKSNSSFAQITGLDELQNFLQDRHRLPQHRFRGVNQPKEVTVSSKSPLNKIVRKAVTHGDELVLYISSISHIEKNLTPDIKEQISRIKAKSSNLNELAMFFYELADNISGKEECIETKSIGVNTHQALYENLSNTADSIGKSVSSFAKQLFIDGLNRIDSALDIKSSPDVFAELEKAYDRFGIRSRNRAKQWQLRLDRKIYSQALVMANEYGLSLSKLAALIIAGQLLVSD